MKIKTSELIGPALDWAVAKAEGERVLKHITFNYEYTHPLVIRGVQIYAPSITPSLGLEIIEREGISWHCGNKTTWHAYAYGSGNDISGPTPLIAAMRAYVQHKLGDEVEVPKELT